jgi:hypothetical protein
MGLHGLYKGEIRLYFNFNFFHPHSLLIPFYTFRNQEIISLTRITSLVSTTEMYSSVWIKRQILLDCLLYI